MTRFAAAVFGLVFVSPAAGGQLKPNVLVIVADDLGFSDLGCYGGEIATPNLDALAANGLRFTQFYNTARCWPSRAALLTGYYAQQVRRDTVPGVKSGNAGVRPGWARLLPEMLKPLGYRSYHSGKWHVDGQPLQNGFDRSYSLEDHDRHFAPRRHSEDDKPLPPVEPNAGYYTSTAIADHAIKCLKDHTEKHADRPFFEYLAFTAPHFPLHAPAEDITRYRKTYLAGWDALRDERWRRLTELKIGGTVLAPIEHDIGPPYAFPDAIKKLGPNELNLPLAWNDLTAEQREFQAAKMAVHAAMVDRMDREIGRVIAQLKAMGALENTLVFFLSDNGASAEIMVRGDGHDPAAAPGSGATYLSIGPGWSSLCNTPFRRHKTWVHEGGICTPLVVHWPKGIAARGELRHTPGHLIDFVPTILEAAGGQRPESWDGRAVPPAPGKSLVPVFAKDGAITRDSLWWQHEGNRALRAGDWKIVAAGKDSPWELYDLSSDRSETKNLAAEKPEKLRELVALWTKRFEEYVALAAKDVPPEAKPDPDAQRTAAMNRPGDAKKGAALFASAALKCAVCHKVNGTGGDAGPDLSQVAGKLDRTHLIESLLDPSAQILEGFRTTVVDLKDGRSLTGIVSNESAAGFTLTDAENKKHAITTADVARRRTSPVSLMPADLCASLTPAEFSDLIAYLDTLRTGRKPSPGEGVAGAVVLPAGFKVEAVANGLTGGTAIEIAPDGRIFVCEQTGALRVVKGGRLFPEPFVRLSVASTWERGLIGVTVAPDFPTTPHVFVCYVAEKPYPHHVISRLTAKGDVAEPGSETILFEGDDQTKLGGNKIDGHQGGAIHFGRDGKLYVAIGEQTAEKPAQNLNSLLGKILRLNPDGTIPEDNPFVKQAEGKYRAVWALGCRNPFAFAVQPKTGRIFINDVGGKAEEINEGVAGANYGWPIADHGPTADPRFRGPVHHYPTACITGGAFVPADSPWPVEYRGKYLFADFNHGFLKTIDPDSPAKSSGFATGLRRPVDLRFAPNGDLYVYVRNAWVIDNQFQPGTSSLLRIRYEAK